MKTLIAALCLIALPAWADPPIRPDATLTPGATLPVSALEICVPGYANTQRHTSSGLKEKVYAEYGITSRKPGEFEIDHLISLELGGADAQANLWPQDYLTMPWNAHVKDKLEDRLHALVCAGTVPLREAQEALRSDWIAAFQKYIGPTP